MYTNDDNNKEWPLYDEAMNELYRLCFNKVDIADIEEALKSPIVQPIREHINDPEYGLDNAALYCKDLEVLQLFLDNGLTVDVSMLSFTVCSEDIASTAVLLERLSAKGAIEFIQDISRDTGYIAACRKNPMLAEFLRPYQDGTIEDYSGTSVESSNESFELQHEIHKIEQHNIFDDIKIIP